MLGLVTLTRALYLDFQAKQPTTPRIYSQGGQESPRIQRAPGDQRLPWFHCNRRSLVFLGAHLALGAPGKQNSV